MTEIKHGTVVWSVGPKGSGDATDRAHAGANPALRVALAVAEKPPHPDKWYRLAPAPAAGGQPEFAISKAEIGALSAIHHLLTNMVLQAPDNLLHQLVLGGDPTTADPLRQPAKLVKLAHAAMLLHDLVLRTTAYALAHGGMELPAGLANAARELDQYRTAYSPQPNQPQPLAGMEDYL